MSVTCSVPLRFALTFAYLDRFLGARGLRYGDLKVLDLGCGGGLMSEASICVILLDSGRASIRSAWGALSCTGQLGG